MRKVFVLLSALCIFQTVLGQGLTGPETATTGVQVTFTYYDDIIIAEPRWMADGAVITTSSSGLTYTATFRWDVAGTKMVEFRDGDNVLASMQVVIESGCNPPPKPDAGIDQLICGQLTTQLGASPVGTFAGRWSIISGSGGLLSNPDQPNSSFSGTAGNIYTLRWTVTNGDCGSSSDDVAVSIQVNPALPSAVSGNARFGSGSFTLSAQGPDAAVSYKWFSNEGKLLSVGATFVTSVIIVSQNPFGFVRAVSAAGCVSNPLPVSLLIEPLPVIAASSSRIVFGQSVRLSASSSYSTYAWTNRSGKVISTLPYCEVSVSDNYLLTVTRSGVSGTGTSAPFLVTNQFEGISANRVVTEIITSSGVTDPSIIEKNTGIIQQVTYTDGLGRIRQEVYTQNSPSRKDIINQTDWDRYGRVSRTYLPASIGSADGRMVVNLAGPSGELATYSNISDDIADDSRPFRETNYEASPLDRLTLTYGEGQNWKLNERPESFYYDVNQNGTGVGQEQIPIWKLDKTTSLPVRDLASGTGFYGAGMLEVQSIKDENNNLTRKYFDRQGNMVMLKIQAVLNPMEQTSDHWSRTIYVYDELNRLRWVLQPELVKNLLNANRNPTAAELAGMAFRYRYDPLGRVAARQEPGRDSILMVYDQRNRIVLMQDGNQRQKTPYRWTFYKYDALNRLIASGIKDTVAMVSQPVMQAVVNSFYKSKSWSLPYEQYVGGSTSMHGYSNKSYPVVTTGTIAEPESYLTVTYYDQYLFLQNWPAGYTFRGDQISGQGANVRVVGLVTGEKEKVLDGGVTWLRKVNYYDDRYNLIQSHADNYKGGTDVDCWLRDFTGKVISQRTLHQESDVIWKDVMTATPIGNRLIRTNATAGWISGAVSVQQLAAGQDGWMEFTATPGSAAIRCAGLSDLNTNNSYTTIDYAIYLTSSNTVSIYEQASARFVVSNAGTFRTGDVFRVQRTGGKIHYYQNGLLLYTSLTPSTTLLMVDVSLNSPDATLAGFRTSFSATGRIVDRRFEYDHAGRTISEWLKLDGGTEILLAANRYNEIGQLSNRRLHATDAAATTARQSVDYRYHIRGWKTAVNNSSLTGNSGEPKDLFGEEWYYELSPPGIAGSPRFDGSISTVLTSNAVETAGTIRTAISLTYDPLDRLTQGNQWVGNLNGNWTSGSLSERVPEYDFNGNIRSLTRKNSVGTVIDNLSYSYAAGTNRLSGIQDIVTSTVDRAAGFIDGNSGATDYSYDRNGNLLTDLNRGISTTITYNILDQPELIRRADNRLHSIMTATGRLVCRVAVYPGSLNAAISVVRQTDFCGPFVYDQDQLQQIVHSDGRIVLQSGRKLFLENGTSTQAYLAYGTTLSTASLKGERYVAVTSVSNIMRAGVMAAGGTSVQAGERLLVRVRAYRTPGTLGLNNPAYVVVKLNGTNLLWPGAAIPLSAHGEHLVEQIVTSPSAGTITVGVTWSSTVSAGEMIYINDFEVIRLTAQVPEYQYFIRDAQGNVRVTFTADPQTDRRQASMESVSAADERNQFLRYDNARFVNAALFDRTNGNLSGWSTRLNGSINERFGMAVSLAVMPGDVISAETYAKFVDPNSTNWTAALASLLSQVTASATGVVADGSSYSTSTGSFPYGGLMSGSTSTGSGPRFYLNWLLFDKDYNYQAAQSGFVRLSSAPREYGQDVVHERLAMPALTIVQPGYVYIYVSNEEQSPVDVYYDDLRVVHQQSPLLQRVDYQPFGMISVLQERENLIPQNVLFGSVSLRRDLGMEDYDFGARYYSPANGRSWQADPLAGKFDRWSSYSWAGNDPVNNIDPDGRDWYRANGSDGKMDEKGKVIWRPGSAEIPGYTNIGSRYTFSVTEKNGAKVSYTYDQLDLVEKAEMVLQESGWMTQNPALNPRGCKTCCYKVSRDMVAAEGVQLTNAYNPKSIGVIRDHGLDAGKRVFRKTPNYDRGISALNTNLDAGRPVVVGVDHSVGTRNIDGVTDHFIVIAGRITDYRNGSVSYRYFDPGNGRAAQGAAANNILRNIGGLYQSDHYFRGTGRHYTLTHIVQ